MVVAGEREDEWEGYNWEGGTLITPYFARLGTLRYVLEYELDKVHRICVYTDELVRHIRARSS